MTMRDALVAIDIGNTKVDVGVFEVDRLVAQYHLTSQIGRTADELIPILEPLLSPHIERLKRSRRAVLASVVPALTGAYETYLARRLGVRPLLLRAGLPFGVKLDVADPTSVGADRIANAVAASELYDLPAVVVDLGSATNFDVVLRGPRYAGGVIAPGVVTSAEELFRRAARLAKVELRFPRRVIGRTTEACVQSGVLYGAAGQIDGICDRIIREIGRKPTIVATGGLAEIFVGVCRHLKRADAGLTLKGLRIVDERVRAARRGRKSA